VDATGARPEDFALHLEQAEVDLEHGDLASARAGVETALEGASIWQARGLEARAMFGLAGCHADDGREARARGLADEALGDPRGGGRLAGENRAGLGGGKSGETCEDAPRPVGSIRSH
jgi:hypothetical protein